MNGLPEFLNIIQREVDQTASTIDEATYADAISLITEAEKTGSRLHITGIGKPAHVAAYMASLFSSTGTPTYFLHGTEAVHGSCGQLIAGDVVICISNSGETAELKATAAAIRQCGCKIIAVTGNPDSWLAEFADAHLFAGVTAEGGPLNRAPRASILAEEIVLLGLSVLLQTRKGLTPAEYVKRHPGGQLGHLREGEK
ncbi:MAG: SIS domain-containing protein [Candidatus Howiella sp.]|jgi:D-arabinose 5-phosphate isomerase GutQ